VGKITRTDLFVHDLVHDNPCLNKYTSDYNSPEFLKKRGYDAKTFDLYNCAQYGLLWDGVGEKYGRAPIFPEGSESRAWVEAKRAELTELYTAMNKQGLGVSFMMDIIVFPKAVTEIFPEILNENGEIDIMKPMTKALIGEMFDEMFTAFPQITGIYIRYGETYSGERYGLPYYKGNNPIIGEGEEYHISLINTLIESVCKKNNREIYYRSWGFGDFQHDKNIYLRISEKIEPHENFYFCIKHTTGDFMRCTPFNQSLGCGKHKQIVEVQAAREYEGKGAFPDYIADGVINGCEEFKWLMQDERPRCLRDVVNTEDSIIKGIWTWSRGGGWDGPYINGKNGMNGEVEVKGGSELWCDINAYVISNWAKDTAKSDKYYALQYAREILGMSETDAAKFYEILTLSAKAVLFGRGMNNGNFKWESWWTRDQNIDPILFGINIDNAIKTDSYDVLLWEKEYSVKLWQQMIELADSITTGNATEYIRVTCRYGYYLFSLFEAMYTANIYARLEGGEEKVADAKRRYDALWEEWKKLKEENEFCPTLYVKEDVNQQLIGYEGNRGFDALMNKI